MQKKNNTGLETKIDNKSYLSNVKSDIRLGGICPVCEIGIFDYDGLLNLKCPNCGYSAGGCFT